MKNCLTLLITFYCSFLIGQEKQLYLSRNKHDLTKSFIFPQKDVKLIGFGAYHGAAKTEVAEIALVSSLIKNNNLRYYIAETDIAIAHFLNEYLASGDEALLKDLIIHYGVRVPQERTIEVFEKWKALKKINDQLPADKKLTVLGPDPIVTYKYTYKYLLSLITNTKEWKPAQELQNTVTMDTTDFSPYYESYSKSQMVKFIADFEENKAFYFPYISDKTKFSYMIELIKKSFGGYNRENEIYNNYLKLYDTYQLQTELVYVRYGFFHIMKAKEGNAESFFFKLLKNNIYTQKNLVSIIGYLNQSEVIWDDIYTDDGNYSHSTTSREGTGDSNDEYFKGIEELKKQKTSDITLFQLNLPESPYRFAGCIDLIEIITPKKSDINYAEQNTVSFADYALLISNSKASRSIFSLQ